MNKKEIEEKIKSISTNSKYYRVSEDHPLELYIGKDINGFPTLRYNGSFKHVNVVGNKILVIKQLKLDEYNSILFSFASEDNLSLFYSFCEDMINNTMNYSGNNGYEEIINRYNQWKKMFYSSSNVLNENEIMGLIGELLFLRDFAIAQFGKNDGLSGWSGPEPTHKDFSYGNEWYEIKTISSNKNTVHISSIEQLDSEYFGKLVVYSLEKMSPNFDGIKLNDLVIKIMKSFDLETDRELFEEKLKQVGYVYNEVYDNYSYHLQFKNTYFVDSEFPRIKKINLPNEVSNVQYELILSSIEKFKE